MIPYRKGWSAEKRRIYTVRRRNQAPGPAAEAKKPRFAVRVRKLDHFRGVVGRPCALGAMNAIDKAPMRRDPFACGAARQLF